MPHDAPTAPADPPPLAAALEQATQLLDVLVAQLHDVVAATEAAALDIVTDAQGVDAQVEALAATAAGLRPTRPAAAASVERSADALGVAATSLLGRTQFQDVTRQSVGGVAASLEQLRATLGGLAACLAGERSVVGLHDALGDLEASYVSQRQRAIHAEVTGAAVVDDGLEAIELF